MPSEGPRPFGVCIAPGTFHRIMRDIFYDFLRYFLEIFIDDIVEHIQQQLGGTFAAHENEL